MSQEVSSILANASKGFTVTSILLLVALLLLCLFLDGYLGTMLRIESSLFRPREWHQLEKSRDFTNYRNFLALVCTFPLSIMLAKLDVCTGTVMFSLERHFQILVIWGFVAGFLLLRWGVLSLVGWTVGRTDAMQMMFYNSLSVVLMALPLVALALVLTFIFPSMSLAARRWMLLTALAIPCLIYYIKNRSFFTTEFSSFFWFLYLCSLEFLPLAVVFKIAMNL